MDRVYAFIDESGAFGWDLANPTVSSFFILTAVIVEESKLNDVLKDADEIRKKFFQTGEMKSSKIGSNHKRRQKILTAISELDCKFFPLICDKEKLANENFKGLQYKKSFYKFLNNIIDTELVKAFPKITIVSDSTGSTDFIESFIKYMKNKVIPPDLFGESDIQLNDSKDNPLIQVADIISGTLQCVYDDRKNVPNEYNFMEIMKKQIIRIEVYPMTFENYSIEHCVLSSEYDLKIASICFQQAKNYIIQNEKNRTDIDIIAQVLTLKYLLFRFMNNNLRSYISTQELLSNLKYSSVGEISKYHFRTKIIGKMRDAGVIISGSHHGYKIPTKKSDLIDYMEHSKMILLPMLFRLKKCRDLIQLGTNKEFDLFDVQGFDKIKSIFSVIKTDIPENI